MQVSRTATSGNRQQARTLPELFIAVYVVDSYLL